MRVEQVTDPVAYHGEGPVWFEKQQTLRWVDMLAGDVLSLTPGDTVHRRHVGSVVAALRPRESGGAVLGLERGFALQGSDGTIHELPELWSSSSVRMNEGACDPLGRFYCGSMAYDKTPGAAKVYRLNTDLSVQIILEDVTISNGLDWSPSGTEVYYNDTATQQISVFEDDPDHGWINRRVLTDIQNGGRPDGLTVDSEGGIWTAIVNQGAVHRYLPNGTLDEVIELPVTRVTACTFGGKNLDQLYITTSRDKIDLTEEPLAGALFRTDVEVSGQRTREFRG